MISRHDIVNAILDQLKNGCQWRDLPADFPNWQTVYSQFRRWQLDGTWQKVLAALARQERESVKNEYPSLLIGDSMGAQNTDTANRETKGYCWYKNTNGIKRHLLVDMLGTLYFVFCTKASLSDDDGLLALIPENKPYFLAYQSDTPSPSCWTTGLTRSIWSRRYRRWSRSWRAASSLNSQRKSRRRNARWRKRRIRRNRALWR